MGKLRDQKRDVRFGRKGPAADAKKMGKAARDKPKHTKHSLFEPAAAAGGGAAARTGAAKPAAKRAAVVGKGVKRALDDAAAATMPSAAADTAAVAPTNARKAAARARLASAGAKAPPSAPRERKALVKRVLPLWEQIRDAKTPTAQREALIADVLRELNATLTQVCGKHDAARVVQASAASRPAAARARARVASHAARAAAPRRHPRAIHPRTELLQIWHARAARAAGRRADLRRWRRRRRSWVGRGRAP